MMRRTRSYGFSLIEMIVAITVLGILSASAAIFLRGPIASYFDTERRTDLADAGTLAMAKLRQDLANAVPNGVRVTTAGGRTYIELLPMRLSAAGVPSQGRYRIGGPGNVLNFGVADNGFDVLGPPVEIQTGDWIVVNNHQAGANVWAANSSRASYTGPSSAAAVTLTMLPHTFAADAPDHRFQIAVNPVTYVCDPGARTLSRLAGYGAPAAVQPTVFGAGVQNDLLARDVLVCRAGEFAGSLRQAQIVAFEIGFERAGDRLNLLHTVRVGALP